MSERQVQRLLDQLCRTGFLAKESRFRDNGSQRANGYLFLFHKVFAGAMVPIRGDKNVTPPVTSVPPLEDSQVKKKPELASEPARAEVDLPLGPGRSGSGNVSANAMQVGRQSRPRSSAGRSPCPWKWIPVAQADVDAIQRLLLRFSEAYPQALFGAASATTARDLMACAQLQVDNARPDDVAAFLSSKFQQRRPAPYEPGIQTFGGVITIIREDFRAWFESKSQLGHSAGGCSACGCPRRRDGVCAGCNRHPEVAARVAEEREARSRACQQGGSVHRTHEFCDPDADNFEPTKP
jgi:hypothetical protein